MYYSFKYLFLFIAILILIKAISPLVSKLTKFKENNYNFNIELKRNHINKLSGFEFEGFCTWLLSDNERFIDVVKTEDKNDGGVDIILTCKNDEKIYVECKRYDKDGDFYIGREICQKLVGAMVEKGIRKGIIITTGKVHNNALEYIETLNTNSSLIVKIIDMDGILEILDKKSSSEPYQINVEI